MQYIVYCFMLVIFYEVTNFMALCYVCRHASQTRALTPDSTSHSLCRSVSPDRAYRLGGRPRRRCLRFPSHPRCNKQTHAQIITVYKTNANIFSSLSTDKHSPISQLGEKAVAGTDIPSKLLSSPNKSHKH
jgi:hypothetical protein